MVVPPAARRLLLASAAVGALLLIARQAQAEPPPPLPAPVPPQAPAASPAPSLAAPSPSLAQLAFEAQADRRQRNIRAMGVLLGWSAVNLGTGTVGYFTTEGPTRYFHQMNAAWNTVNATIGAFGLIGALRESPGSLDPLATLEEGRRLERILFLNLGLNVSYLAAGAWLWERGLRQGDDRLLGYGPSLLLQGSFLLIFDTIQVWLQSRASRRYAGHLQVQWQQGPKVGWSARF